MTVVSTVEGEVVMMILILMVEVVVYLKMKVVRDRIRR